MDDLIAEHIITHSKDCSLLLVKNGETVISVNKDSRRPLASIYKLIILLAYLDQCKKGKLHPKDQVHFRQLKRYWIHWVDPSFMKWYHFVKDKNKIRKDSVALSEVVKGMLEHSCNAHTDYLLSILGMDVINEQFNTYAIRDHDPVMPISTSILVILRDALQMQHTPFSLAKEADRCFQIMMEGKKIEGLDLNLLNDFDYKMQCRWSDVLPHATASSYSKLLMKIQQLHKSNKELQEVMGWFEKLRSYRGLTGGMKLGYTPKVFNVALYATDKEGNNYQLVYFLNNLTVEQKQAIELTYNDFNLKMLRDPLFINQLKNQMAHVNIC
ncbi:serine hydrolase [Dokdonia sp.]|uniref:serine hydrolase n=1 Tax=Dokdonia sp. TaxID=2024995 RepID=UPI0032639006